MVRQAIFDLDEGQSIDIDDRRDLGAYINSGFTITKVEYGYFEVVQFYDAEQTESYVGRYNDIDFIIEQMQNKWL